MEKTKSQIVINPIDIIRLIQQFCKENNFVKTLEGLEQESGVKLNTVESIQTFRGDIKNGRWDLVLPVIDKLDIQSETLLDLYEQIIYDLIINDDRDVAKIFLMKISREASRELRINYNENFKNLENLINDNRLQIGEFYLGTNKEKRRQVLADKICKELKESVPGQLQKILSEGVYELIKRHPDTEYDILTGRFEDEKKESNQHEIKSILVIKDSDKIGSSYIKNLFKQISFGEKYFIEVAKFSPCGEYLATGSTDGFIEIWDPKTASLKSSLSYQFENSDLEMIHKQSVISLAFTKDSKMLASGDVQGQIKIFKVANGKCLRDFPNAHSKGINCLIFSKDNSQIISGDYDSKIRVHGLKAGILIVELSSHTSFINDLQIDWNENKVFSASADGTVKIWSKDYELINNLYTPKDSSVEVAINNIVLNSLHIKDSLFICTRSNKIYLMSYSGEILFSYTSHKNFSFINCALSENGQWMYALDEENILYTFSTEENTIKNFFKIEERDNLAIQHSPTEKLLVSYSTNGNMNFYK
jgi:WD40 repeat-containing protein SMU1